MTPLQNMAFTARFSARVLRLTGEVEIFPAFSPDTIPPPSRKYQALYDTGATHSVISPKVVQELNLPLIGARTVGVAGGFVPTTSHLVNVGLPNRVMFGMIPVAKLAIPSGEDVIIGMDILGMGDFAVTHYGGNTVFSFCVPSRKCIDFAEEINAFNRAHPPAKNGLCHCGSGKKYKSCHGRRHF